MKLSDIETVIKHIDHVVCYRLDPSGWELYVYGDEEDRDGYREISRLGNRVTDDENRRIGWNSLDAIVQFLVSQKIHLSMIHLDG